MSELSEMVQLHIECKQCRPAPPPGQKMLSYDREVPKYIVSGVIIGFHSSHEGHQLEVKVDDTVYLP